MTGVELKQPMSSGTENGQVESIAPTHSRDDHVRLPLRGKLQYLPVSVALTHLQAYFCRVNRRWFDQYLELAPNSIHFLFKIRRLGGDVFKNMKHIYFGSVCFGNRESMIQSPW